MSPKVAFQIPSHLDSTHPHSYIPPTMTSSRSPCPALNALANHGLLPRSGRGLKFCEIITAVKTVYGVSSFTAFLLTFVIYILIGKWFTTPVDLHDFAKHNRIEHDASLVHKDADPNNVGPDGVVYAPVQVDQNLLQRFLGMARPSNTGSADQIFTTSIFAHYRVAREMEATAPLDWFHSVLGRGECSLLTQVFGGRDEQGNYIVRENAIADFMAKDRLPAGWKPLKIVGFFDIIKVSIEVGNKMNQIKKTKPVFIGHSG